VRKALAIAAVVAAAFLLPQAASAGLATIASRDLPLQAGRTLAGTASPFDLVGLHWRGNGRVELSARSLSGRWSAWQDAAPEAEDQPDPGSREGRAAATRRWNVGNPIWVGLSTAFRYRTTGRVTALRGFFVRSPSVGVPLRSLATAAMPAIVPRSAWGADESIRVGAPQYAPSVRYAVVHHTATTNDYTQAQAPAIMRAIQLYHVRSNGWNDIGYNFLVDRFGTVYEGRYGGIDRNVVGAHAKGFNTGSVGVAVIGGFEGAGIPPAARSSLAALLAWRLDLAHVDPLSTLTAVSSGSDRFPSGIPVFLRAVSGHRDTGLTACPGDALYAKLGEIATETQAIGLPKLYEPRLTGALGGPVRFRARLSKALPWTVTITDAAGAPLATGTGSTATVDWTWDSTGLGLAGVSWRIGAGATLTAAAGSLGVSGGGSGGGVGTGTVALAIAGAAADPETITPNADGADDATTLTYTTTAASTVDVTLLDAAGGVVTQLLEPTRQPAGEHTLIFDGLGLPDGVYTFVVTAIGDDGARVTSPVTTRITRTLGQATVAPAIFAPGAAGRPRRLGVTFQLAAAATVRVRILRDGKWVATPFKGALAPGPQLVGWDGAKRLGRALDGSYTAVVEATDAVGTAAITLPFLKDTTPPRLRVLAGKKPRLWVSEPASLTVRVNGAVRRLAVDAAGPVALPGVRTLRTLVAVARDAAGNRTVLRRPLEPSRGSASPGKA
jgi:hypothetical protein